MGNTLTRRHLGFRDLNVPQEFQFLHEGFIPVEGKQHSRASTVLSENDRAASCLYLLQHGCRIRPELRERLDIFAGF